MFVLISFKDNLAAFAARRRPFKKNKALTHSTKPLLPAGDMLSFPHDPVEMRRLNFQTPGQTFYQHI